MLKLLLAVFLTCSLFPVSADVFSLWPFTGSGNAANADANSVLNGDLLWNENVRINGKNMTLEITLVHRSLNEALTELRRIYKTGKVAINSNSLLFDTKDASGIRKRYYLVAANGISPVLQFAMVFPANYRKGNGRWDPSLPLPSNATVKDVMIFPKRNSFYGSFESDYPAGLTVSDLSRQLESMGWKNQTQSDSSGGVFLKDKPMEILILSVQSNERQGSSGSIYRRKIDKSDF